MFTTHYVTSSSQLQQALDDALPGDTIRLADGIYADNFVIQDNDGTAKNPITLIGSSNAILDGESTDRGYGLYLDGANYWKLEGFTVRNALKGIMLDASNHNLIDGVTVHTIGHEGVHFRKNSSHNTIQFSSIRDTGKKPPRSGKPDLGEGIYIGSAKSNWERYMGDRNTPDRSNFNKVLYNTIGENVTSEAIDIKEGTIGGEIIGNRLDAAGKIGANSYIDVKGNEYLIKDNSLLNNPHPENYGIDVFSLLKGWGQDNTFDSNINESDLSLAKLKLNRGVTGTVQIDTRDDESLGSSPSPDQLQDDADSPADDSGNDTLNGNDVLDDGAGGELLRGGKDEDTLNGGAGDDTLLGEKDDDLLDGGGGDDLLSGGDREDTLNGGQGNDTLNGGDNDDLLDGGGGDDLLSGGDREDTITGGQGNDTLLGGDNDDVLIGVDPTASQPGMDEVDTLTGDEPGDEDDDIFVLGDESQVYYDNGNEADYALITDFDDQDMIRLSGSAGDYELGTSPTDLPGGTAIFLTTGGTDELIGIVQDTSNLDLLDDKVFSFV